MTTNTQLLLQGIINDRKAELAAEMEDDKFFQIFCLTEALKRYDLSLDEIQEGNVDGGNDGGIDALFIFVDGDPLTPYYQMRQRRDAVIELTIVQCKNTESFSGTAIDKLISTVNTLFDYSRPLSDLRATYNERLVERATLFRDFHLRNVAQFARLVVRFVYFSRAEREHGGLSQQVATLVAAAERLFPNATISFDFVGAVKLLEFARTDRVERLQLPITEGPIVVGEGGYLALVSLSDYYRFVVDSEGGRRRSLFLSNVRDYEGAVAVNRAIAATLRGDVPEDFWVLNNGVTLLAANVRVGYKSLVIEEPVIVNGLQTTLEIIRHFRQSADVNDPRMVLVRVMIPKTAESRDRVIVATNNQTAIAPGALRATDQVHRDIEQYFASKGLFYERRRNSQRNEGHPIEQIVTMPFLTKCMCAVSLQRPDLAVKINAHGRLLTRDYYYSSLFDSSQPLSAFLNAVLIVRRVQGFLERAPIWGFDDRHMVGKYGQSGWMAWHLSCYIAQRLVGDFQMSSARLGAIDQTQIDSAILQSGADELAIVFSELKRQRSRTLYQIAKGEPALRELFRLMARPMPVLSAPPEASDRKRRGPISSIEPARRTRSRRQGRNGSDAAGAAAPSVVTDGVP